MSPVLMSAMCNMTELEGFLSAQDSVCSAAFEEITNGNLLTISVENASNIIQNLCGSRCGEFFYNAVDRSCMNSSDLLQLYCSRFTNREGMTIYCSYLESLPEFSIASEGIGNFCIPISSQCSQECVTVLRNVIEDVGCCLPERFSNPSVPALRPEESALRDFFTNEGVYSACSLQRPTLRCGPPFQNGRPVFTKYPPSPSSTTDTENGAAPNAKAHLVYLFAVQIVMITIFAKL